MFIGFCFCLFAYFLFCFFPSDIQAPSFNETCPSAQTVLADEGKTSATVSWGPVIATDNDQALVSVSPNVTSPYEFAEGGHTLIYTATDRSGNTRFCHFRVTVLGKKHA